MSKVATLIGFVVLAGTVYGHHSTVAIFDATKTVEITGVVADVSWRNPHGRIVVEVDQESGKRWNGRSRLPRSASCAIGDSAQS